MRTLASKAMIGEDQSPDEIVWEVSFDGRSGRRVFQCPEVPDYNLERCSNPLHQFHRVPVDRALEPDIDYVYRAAKYVEKTFSLFDKKTGITVDIDSSLDLLVDALTKLGATPPTSGNDDEPN
jgi:hypothetical protein